MEAQIDKTVILISNHFPYGHGEAFIEIEMGFLTRKFKEVIVVSRDVKSTHVRQTKEKFTCVRLNPESGIREMLLCGWLLLRKLRLITRIIKQEYRILKYDRKLSRPVLQQMVHDLAKGLVTAWHIEKIIDKRTSSGNVILYSYWMNNSALALALVSKRRFSIAKLSRAHGGDIYEERNNLKYLSFRETIVERLDAIFTISKDGKRHLQRAISKGWHGKVRLSRLGTSAQSIQTSERTNRFRIVSCAFIVEVKRIDLLIEALALVNTEVEWIHIGNGPLKEKMAALASEKLQDKKNIYVDMKGTMTNSDLMNFYRSSYVNAFVNTSMSEGIPVTIMEAQSFGIPVIAPAVGGIPEIVDNENGLLLAASASATDFAEAIMQMASMPTENYNNLRTNALLSWKNRYNAERNFSNFVAQIDAL